MSQAKAKYLKDEEGNMFSPIISADSVFMPDGTNVSSNINSINNKFSTMSGVKRIDKTLTLGASWLDTGITGADFTDTGTGVYCIRVYCNANSAGWWSENIVGICSIYSGTCNNTGADQITTHTLGHARNGHTISLRWIRQSGGGYAKLQILADAAWSSSSTLEFYFRRLL